MSKFEIAGIPDGLKRLLASESDATTLFAIAKYLKSTRNYLVLAWYSERLLRRDSTNLRLWQMQAQALVELGFLSAADEVLDSIRAKVQQTQDNALSVDLIALEGRIAKQRLAEAAPNDKKNQSHLKSALKYYLAAHEKAGSNSSLRYFPGINIVSLLSLARRLNLQSPKELVLADWAQRVRDDLEAVKDKESNYHWWQATSAECALALGDYQTFEDAVFALVKGKKSEDDMQNERSALDRVRAGGYLQHLPDVDPFSADAFVLSAFDRQLREIWDVDTKAPSVLRVVMGLREVLLGKSGGSLEFDASTLGTIYQQQAVFGQDGPLPFKWVLQGIDRARSVAGIMAPDGFGKRRRIGTGFVVAMEGGGNDHFVLTNQHVVPGTHSADSRGATTYNLEDIRISFDAVEPDKMYKAAEIVWGSSAHDVSLLRLTSIPKDIKPLQPRMKLPTLSNTTRVYIIGHPNGEQLQMSLQDNELLDEDPAPGTPPETPIRLHYRTPTREGNSGSPVFAQEEWSLIGIHRASLTLEGPGMTLSGYRRYNRANEGVSIASVDAALRLAGKSLSFSFAEPDDD